MTSELMNRKLRSSRFRWHGMLLDFSNISSIDSTALSVLEEIIDTFQKRPLLLCIANMSMGVCILRCAAVAAAVSALDSVFLA